MIWKNEEFSFDRWLSWYALRNNYSITFHYLFLFNIKPMLFYFSYVNWILNYRILLILDWRKGFFFFFLNDLTPPPPKTKYKKKDMQVNLSPYFFLLFLVLLPPLKCPTYLVHLGLLHLNMPRNNDSSHWHYAHYFDFFLIGYKVLQSNENNHFVITW